MKTERAIAAQLTGRDVFVMVAAFFLLIIVVDSVLVYKAVSTFGGIETVDAYRKGLAYNKRIEQRAAMDELKWQTSAGFDPHNGAVYIELHDQASQGLDQLLVTGALGRPATNQFDQPLVFRAVGNGRYEASATMLTEGVWNLTFRVMRGARPGDEAPVYEAKVRLWKQP